VRDRAFRKTKETLRAFQEGCSFFVWAGYSEKCNRRIRLKWIPHRFPA
jgi:hypothetical protein